MCFQGDDAIAQPPCVFRKKNVHVGRTKDHYYGLSNFFMVLEVRVRHSTGGIMSLKCRTRATMSIKTGKTSLFALCPTYSSIFTVGG